jgi:hypothetical protein
MEDMTSMERWVFIKPFKAGQGTLPENSEITLFRGLVYYNGGLCDPISSQELLGIINNPQTQNEYLRKIKIIENKV